MRYTIQPSTPLGRRNTKSIDNRRDRHSAFGCSARNSRTPIAFQHLPRSQAFCPPQPRRTGSGVKGSDRPASGGSCVTNGMPDPEILRKYNLQMPKEACIIPETFLIRGGKLLPYEFTCIEGDAARQNLEMIDLMQRRQDFLDGWTRVIKDHGLEDRLGLTIREEEDSNSDIPKVMVFDAKERVDILFSPTKDFPISVSPRAPPAEWEVRQGSRDGGYECARSRWCRDWVCPVCGYSNSSGTTCQRCGSGIGSGPM